MKILDKSLDLAYSLFPTIYANRTKYQSFHFSFLFKRTKLISLGYNDYALKGEVLYLANKFNIVSRKKVPSLHSEWAAISRAWGRYHLNNSIKLVNVRLNIKGEIHNSKPCSACAELLSSLNINKIWYTCNGQFYRY